MAAGNGDRAVVRVRITGRVQGVWFRAWTAREAARHGLDGWVRNRRNGDVEAVFAGPRAAVDAMVAACHQGPRAARVDRVERGSEPGRVEPGFIQMPTV